MCERTQAHTQYQRTRHVNETHIKAAVKRNWRQSAIRTLSGRRPVWTPKLGDGREQLWRCESLNNLLYVYALASVSLFVCVWAVVHGINCARAIYGQYFRWWRELRSFRVCAYVRACVLVFFVASFFVSLHRVSLSIFSFVSELFLVEPRLPVLCKGRTFDIRAD